MSAEMLHAAQVLIDHQFRVLPIHRFDEVHGRCSCGDENCSSPGKHPRTRNGCRDAVADVLQFMDVTAKLNGDSNLAIATGESSGVFVVDVECPAVESFQSKGPLPETVIAETGGGGRHYYFRLPSDREIGNRVRIHDEPIDTRGGGGYVLCPPSNHASGGQYRWINAPGTTPIADAPEWLLDFVTSRKTGGSMKLKVAESLASASGASVGQRHQKLTELIGRAVAEGGDENEVRQQAFAFRDRCEEPEGISEREVDSLVDFCMGREEENDPELFEPLPLSRWPQMRPEGFYGILGDAVKAIGPETEADLVAIYLQSLARFGVQVGRKPHFLVDGARHYANLFVVVVGQTARGSKGTSGARVRQLFEPIEPEFDSSNTLGSLVSGEGLIEFLRDPVIESKAIVDKTTKQVTGYTPHVVSAGMTDKRLLVVESEMGRVFVNAGREGSILSMTLRDLWDHGNAQVPRRKDPAKVSGAHLGVIGHITSAEIRRTLAETEFWNGFGNRFLWAMVRRSKLLPEGGSELFLEPHVERIRDTIQQAREIGRMERDNDARTLWREIYYEIEEAIRPGVFGAITERASAQILRLSLVLALTDTSAVIRAEHLRAAKAIWDYCEDSCRFLFNEQTGDPINDRLIEVVREEPGISRRNLRRHFSNSIKATPELITRLAELRDLGVIFCTKCGKSEKWFPGSETPTDASDDDSLIDFI